LFERSSWRATTVRDQDVDLTERLNAGVHHAVDVSRLANVGGHRDDLGPAFGEGDTCGLERLSTARADDQPHPLGGQLLGHSATQPAARRGHDRHSAAQTQIHVQASS
jgi:hypothetical protein